MTRSLVLTVAVASFMVSCSRQPEQTSHYPTSRKVDTVNTYFGTAVSDPYRWLENDTAVETADWVKSENEVTTAYLSKIPYRDQVLKRLESVYNYERFTAPFLQGEYYYYYKNSGLQNHNVLYRRKAGSDKAELFLDPNAFSKDGTSKLSSISFSKDGSLAAYEISDGGADWTRAVVITTADKAVIDSLHDLKFTELAWKGNEGFYYSTYDKPAGSQLSAKTQNHKLFYHSLRSAQASDPLIFGGDAKPRRYISGALTEDQRFLVVQAAISSTGNELYVQDLTDPKAKLITIVGNFENNNNVVDNNGSRLIIQTNLNAPNYRVVEVDPTKPEPENWKAIIPESGDAIDEIGTAGRKIFINYLKDAHSFVSQFDYSGKHERDITLPGIGTAAELHGKASEKEIYYTFTSFTFPVTVFRYNIATGKSTLYAKPEIDFDAGLYVTELTFYKSKDSTKIPMFITYKKGLERNGKNPTLLYAYGGFNISMTPAFSTSRIVWLENGGVYAQPCLRGGGEYGEKWHQAGTKLNKQNVFDDFIAAGEYLVSEKYTSPEYLAISGGSNGGLLVGATMTQRPDLAKVALPGVGVMDMLRYHKFTAGGGWASDYGTADDSKEMFEYLRKYSPLHALKPGTVYPATLVTTADHDDRVVPSHSFKFAATLQEDNAGNNPVLIRIDAKSGHSSSNLSKTMALHADMYTFAWYSMGFVPPMAKKGM